MKKENKWWRSEAFSFYQSDANNTEKETCYIDNLIIVIMAQMQEQNLNNKIEEKRKDLMWIVIFLSNLMLII